MVNYVNLHPGAEAAEDKRAWQGCPTIARTRKGRLFAGWYSGGLLEPCIDNYNILVKSDDNGESWSDPILTVGSDREHLMRNIDIQLWVDSFNQLWVMYTHSPYYATSTVATIRTPFKRDYHTEFTGVELLLCKDPDAEELTFEDPRVICDGFLRCKPIETASGRYIFPAYDWTHPDHYYLRYSDDKGQTFYNAECSEKMGGLSFDETMVYEGKPDADGNRMLRYLVRTVVGCIGASESYDGGKTWTKTHEYMKYPSARFYIGRLSSGALCMVRNISETERTGMKVMLSDDDGETWTSELVLDTREFVSYPDLAEENGTLYIVHDRERDNRYHIDRENWTSTAAKEILISRVTEEDVRSGKIGEGSFAARILSKGRMNFVEK